MSQASPVASGGGMSPPALAIQAVTHAPLSQIAPLTGRPAAQLLADLASAGVPLTSADQSVASVVGADRERQGKAIAVLFQTP
jgi:aryl-alcohol dehydrogenase-like predicted oxidoreductase